MALCSKSHQSKSVWVRASRELGFTLKHLDNWHQVEHSCGTLTMEIYVDYRQRLAADLWWERGCAVEPNP